MYSFENMQNNSLIYIYLLSVTNETEFIGFVRILKVILSIKLYL